MGKEASNKFIVNVKKTGTHRDGEIKNFKVTNYGTEGQIRITFLYRVNLSTAGYDSPDAKIPTLLIQLFDSNGANSYQPSIYLAKGRNQLQSLYQWSKFEDVIRIKDNPSGARLMTGTNLYDINIKLVPSTEISVSSYGWATASATDVSITYKPEIVTAWNPETRRRTGDVDMDSSAFDGLECFYFRVGYKNDSKYSNRWRGNIKFKPEMVITFKDRDGYETIRYFFNWVYQTAKSDGTYSPEVQQQGTWEYMINLPIGDCDSITFDTDAYFNTGSMRMYFKPLHDISGNFNDVEYYIDTETVINAEYTLKTEMV